MKNCGSLQMKEICETISKLDSISGTSSSSNPAILFSILYLISKDPKKGRIQISRILATSEQIVRNAIRRLSELEFLTSNGRVKNVRTPIAEAMKCLFVRRLIAHIETLGWENPLLVGFYLSNGRKLKIGEVLEIRDEIIKWGGNAAIVFSVMGKTIDVPGIEVLREIEEVLKEEGKRKNNGIYALVSSKYDYNDFFIFYGFVKKVCELQSHSENIEL